MKYAEVQESLETYVKANWTFTAIAFDNVPFQSELYTEYIRCNVLFGLANKKSLPPACYRQTGVLMLTVFTKPGTGKNRLLELANEAATLVTDVRVNAIPPHVAPVVNLKTPDFNGSNTERSGWIQAEVSSPFYYDWSK